MAERLQPLAVPPAQSVRFERNLITHAACEFRFPTLLELEEKKPVKFQASLRKSYPHFARQRTLSVSTFGSSNPSEVFYVFGSSDGKWVVTLKSFSLALETTGYTEFDDFFVRLENVLSAAKVVIDTDFFTRVGLRYINSVPIGKIDSFAEWINPEILMPLATGVYGSIAQCTNEIMGFTETGGRYTFRHGIAEGKEDYGLDFDFFKENVPVKEALTLVKNFNALNFRSFDTA